MPHEMCDHDASQRPGAVGRAEHLQGVFEYRWGSKQPSRTASGNPPIIGVPPCLLVERAEVLPETKAGPELFLYLTTVARGKLRGCGYQYLDRPCACTKAAMGNRSLIQCQKAVKGSPVGIEGERWKITPAMAVRCPPEIEIIRRGNGETMLHHLGRVSVRMGSVPRFIGQTNGACL